MPRPNLALGKASIVVLVDMMHVRLVEPPSGAIGQRDAERRLPSERDRQTGLPLFESHAAVAVQVEVAPAKPAKQRRRLRRRLVIVRL